MIAVKLALREILRNRFRFGVVALIVALITLMVLLQVSLAEGLTLSSSQYIAGIDAELMVFRDTAKQVITASNLGLSELKKFRHVPGVKAVGPIGFSTASILLQQGGSIETFEVALIGVEPGMPGAPTVFAGAGLADERKMEVVLDQNILDKVNIPIGSTISIQVVQGIDEEIYNLTVVGHTEGKKFSLPGIFVPLQIWDRVKPQERRGGGSEIIYNVAAVKLDDPAAAPQIVDAFKQQINRIDVADLTTAYQSLPGYRDMQDIMSMMQGFVVLVAMLVIGVFFQIQALQKIVQVGMLKAIGASNRVITLSLLCQVMLITLLGIVVGSLAVWAITASLPSTITIVYNGPKMMMGMATLLLMGPLSSFFAVRTLLKVEPLKALGLAR